MYRGGNWNNGANAGVFYLNGNNARSNSYAHIGFRPALASFVIVCEPRLGRNTEAKGAYFPADKAKDERPRRCRWRHWDGSLLVEAARGNGQTAQAGRSCASR